MDTESQENVQKMIEEFYSFAEYTPNKAREYKDEETTFIDKGLHSQFIFESMLRLGTGYQSVDSGQPWIPYWLLNTQYILDQPVNELPKVVINKLIKYLKLLHNDEKGGFRGAKGFGSHIASSYAGVLAIVNLGTEDAYQIIDKNLMKAFLKSMFNNGSVKIEAEK